MNDAQRKRALVKSATRKGCTLRVKWVDDRSGVLALLMNQKGNVLNLIRGYKTLPPGIARRRAEKRLLDSGCAAIAKRRRSRR